MSSLVQLARSSSALRTTVLFGCGIELKATLETFTIQKGCKGVFIGSLCLVTRLILLRVFSAKFTPDSHYVLSGSDDGNIRLWRANASHREGIKSARQRQKLEYDEALKQRYKHMPEIRRIHRHRPLPKQVKKASEIKAEEIKSRKRRAENERKHTKKSLQKRVSERDKMVLAVEK